MDLAPVRLDNACTGDGLGLFGTPATTGSHLTLYIGIVRPAFRLSPSPFVCILFFFLCLSFFCYRLGSFSRSLQPYSSPDSARARCCASGYTLSPSFLGSPFPRLCLCHSILVLTARDTFCIKTQPNQSNRAAKADNFGPHSSSLFACFSTSSFDRPTAIQARAPSRWSYQSRDFHSLLIPWSTVSQSHPLSVRGRSLVLSLSLVNNICHLLAATSFRHLSRVYSRTP